MRVVLPMPHLPLIVTVTEKNGHLHMWRHLKVPLFDRSPWTMFVSWKPLYKNGRRS